jgi:hypothetical protein
MFRPARGFVCMRCGEFVEVDDDSAAAACDCEREAERREIEQRKSREEWRRHLINRYREMLMSARWRAKRTGRQFRAEHRR